MLVVRKTQMSTNKKQKTKKFKGLQKHCEGEDKNI
jgi:hypothetical protein